MAGHIDQSLPAQRKIVLECLRRRPHSTYDLRKCGISHPASRIRELIAEGHLIQSSRITTVDSDGFVHDRVAMYELASPSSQDQQ